MHYKPHCIGIVQNMFRTRFVQETYGTYLVITEGLLQNGFAHVKKLSLHYIGQPLLAWGDKAV